MSKIEQVLWGYFKDNSIDLEWIISNLDNLKEGLKRNIKTSTGNVLGLDSLVYKYFENLPKEEQVKIYKELEKVFIEEDKEKIKEIKENVEKLMKWEAKEETKEEVVEEVNIEDEILKDLSDTKEQKEPKEEVKIEEDKEKEDKVMGIEPEMEIKEEKVEEPSLDIDFWVDLDLSSGNEKPNEEVKAEEVLEEIVDNQEEKIPEAEVPEVPEIEIEKMPEEPKGESIEVFNEKDLGFEEQIKEPEIQEEVQEEKVEEIKEEPKETPIIPEVPTERIEKVQEIEKEINEETPKIWAYNDFSNQDPIQEPKMEENVNKEEKMQEKDNITEAPKQEKVKAPKKPLKETLKEIYLENKKNILIVWWAILLLGLISIVMSFIPSWDKENPKPIETEVEVQKTNTWTKTQTKEDKVKEKETTDIVKIEDNKIKIQNVIKGLKNTYDGFKIEEVRNWDNIFLSSKVYFYNLAKTDKTKTTIKKTLDPIYKVDKEMNKIKVVWLKVTPTINDNILKTTCNAYFKDKLDCDNLVVLRKQDKLKEISAKVIKQKVWYFLEVGIPLFIDDNYNLLKNENEDLLYVNDFLLKKMSPIFDKMSEKEVGLLKAYLDDKDGILNTRFRIISNDKVRQKMLKSIKWIYVKATKIKNKDLSEKEAVLWLKYYYYLVYKLFNT